MLYYLIDYLERLYQPPGFQMIQFIQVRASLAAITALVIALLGGRYIINWLAAQQLGESVREGEEAGAVDHAHKAGTPTMGGVIILFSVLGATLLWGAILEMYVWLMMLATAWMGAVGFADDYIKTIQKNKDGLNEWIKIAAQVSIGLIVGGVLYFHPDVPEDIHTLTYLPFYPGHAFDYYIFEQWLTVDIGWVIYLPVVVFIMTAMSNAVNLTDGLDGLTTGVTAFVSLSLVVLCYASGSLELARNLELIYIPGSAEITVFAASLSMACFGFLWYNGYPANVFMGDTGSLAMGAAVGAVTLAIRKELLLPVLGLVYFAEALSVIVQTLYFKYTKRRAGRGRRIFAMAPLHHHYEAKGAHESKIVTRFWIITAITVIATLLALRIR
jgi:phospho-N-acetylmuramoyl-pentapeptide-transferase